MSKKKNLPDFYHALVALNAQNFFNLKRLLQNTFINAMINRLKVYLIFSNILHTAATFMFKHKFKVDNRVNTTGNPMIEEKYV